jgi:MSHA type pilus biogenesis protein MshL
MFFIEPQVAAQTEFPYEGKLFSLSVRNVPFEDVLLSLAQEASLNLIIDMEVRRDELISVEFANIPLQTALDNLIEIYDYFYTIEKGVLSIQALEERIFKVNYPLIYTKPESTIGGDVLGSGSGGGGGGAQSQTVQTSQGSSMKAEFEISATVEDEDNLDVWKQIEEALTLPQAGNAGLLSSDGMVRINRMGSTILVKDHPSNVRSIDKFLQSIEETLRRQVIIHAKIIEVVLDKSHQYGINWEHVRFNFARSGGILETSVNLGELATTGLTMHFADFVGMDQGEAFLHALATNGTVNMLSSPRLSVINNQSAFINVGRIVPFLDFQVGQSTQTGGGFNNDFSTISSVPVISRFNEGVTLGITPQIDGDGSTILHIVPIVTEQVGVQPIEVPSQIIGGDSTLVDIPIIAIRESDTMVRIEDRTTVVIGGLIQDKTGDIIKKIPLLGDIPIVQWAFSHQERENKKTELVILLTTTVVMR